MNILQKLGRFRTPMAASVVQAESVHTDATQGFFAEGKGTTKDHMKKLNGVLAVNP